MGVTPLRLLLTSAVLVVGAALMPAVGAVAAPTTVAAHQVGSERDVAALTQREAVLDSAAQRTSDPDGRTAGDEIPAPPLWLLLLLVPVLVGGAIGTGVTLRRIS